jgi:surface antigen
MPVAEPSYTDVSRRRQLARVAAALTVMASAAGLTGCAGMGLPFGGLDRTTTASIRPASTQAVADATFINRVDPTDWEALKQTIAAAPATATGDIDWSNPITGTTGAVSVAAIARVGAASCRTFTTTINDVRGARHYRGQACAAGSGMVELRGVAADDLTVS